MTSIRPTIPRGLGLLVAVVAWLTVTVAPAQADVVMTSPKSGATVAGVVGVVTRTAATDDVARVDLIVDGVITGSAWSAPWSVLWDTRSVADGGHDVRLVATSSAGAATKTTVSRVTVANGGGGGLAATYYRRRDLTDPAFTRTDATVSFDWGRNHPAAELPADGFSVRWAGTIEAPTTDIYTFVVQADDGVRLWLGTRLLIDQWGRRGWAEHTATVSLTAGQHHALRLEYLEDTGDASVRLRWKSFHTGLTTIPQRVLRPSAGASARTTGLRATFFKGRSMRAKSRLTTRVDPTLEFKWGSGSPDSAVPHDDYVARWSGKLRAPKTGRYRFTARADDGVRVWVGSRMVLGDWRTHPAKSTSGWVRLRKGQVYRLRIDYYEAWGESELSVSWRLPKAKKDQVLPTRYLSPDPAPPEPPKPTTGLIGTYYDDATMQQEVLRRLDNEIRFAWGGGAPDPAMSPDTFSARWTGAIVPPTSGTYELATGSDDGVRVFVDGQVVIEDWRIHGKTWNAVKLNLVAGQAYAIEIQYYEGNGGADMELAWTPPGGKRATIPTQYLQPREPVGPPLKRQPPPAPAVPQPGLWGVYYDNEDFSGTMAGRVDAQLAMQWKGGRPHPSIGNDTFSVAWTGTLAVPWAGDYTFATEADDGVRVWLDGRLVIDRWNWRTPPIDRSAPIRLETGRRYDLRIEHHDGGGDSGIVLRWSTAGMPEQAIPAWALMTPGSASPDVVLPQPPTEFGAVPPTPQPGLFGLYFDDAAFTTPKLSRVDVGLDFDWKTGKPDPRVGADTFSIRWLGTVEVPSAGEWKFHVRADDGVRLRVCGELLVDQWREQGATEYTSKGVRLEPGTPCPITVEYYENGGDASMRLQWSSAAQVKQSVPASALRTPLASALTPLWWW